jgi:hypothetical protein
VIFIGVAVAAAAASRNVANGANKTGRDDTRDTRDINVRRDCIAAFYAPGTADLQIEALQKCFQREPRGTDQGPEGSRGQLTVYRH